MAKFKIYYEHCLDIGIGMPPFIWGKSGVYAIVCDATGKMYIGCSNNMIRRLKQHTKDLRKGTHSNAHLQSAWNKHGHSKFHASVIQYAEESRIYEEEVRWIAEFDSQANGFNLTAGGDGIWLLDEEVKKKTRKKINEALRTEEVSRKIGDWSRQFHIDNKDMMQEVLRQNALSGWAKLSQEERTARAMRVWATRRKNKNG